MIIRKTLIAATAAALVSAPAWALSNTAASQRAPSSTPVGPPSTTPNNLTNPGHLKQGATGPTGNSGSHGKSHKCAPHKVAYVVHGTLAEEAKLTKNPDGTYSSELTVNVKRFNHHAKPEKLEEVKREFTLTKVHVVFAISDTNKDGSVDALDLKVGDQITLIGKITVLAKKCDHSKFEAKKTFRQVIFHPAAS
jgi:hypothetical protein